VPDDWEVSDAAEVLCDADCVVKVNNDMPPSTRYKHRLTSALQYLNLTQSHTKHYPGWLVE